MLNHAKRSNDAYMLNLAQRRQFLGRVGSLSLMAFLFCVLSLPAVATDSLSWRTNSVSADIQSVRLVPVLERVARGTGWKVFLEPGVGRTVSAKFTSQPPGEALRLLLGDLNYALVPETNGPSKLFVFRTAQQNATQLIRGA